MRRRAAVVVEAALVRSAMKAGEWRGLREDEKSEDEDDREVKSTR